MSYAASGRELVLPTGAVHIVVRLCDRPLRVFKDHGDAVGDVVGCSVIGGLAHVPTGGMFQCPGRASARCFVRARPS